MIYWNPSAQSWMTCWFMMAHKMNSNRMLVSTQSQLNSILRLNKKFVIFFIKFYFIWHPTNIFIDAETASKLCAFLLQQITIPDLHVINKNKIYLYWSN
jgi:hypothetical protein